MSPDFWNNVQEAEKHMKKLRNLKKWVTHFNELKSKIEELEIYLEFAKNGESNPNEILITYNET